MVVKDLNLVFFGTCRTSFILQGMQYSFARAAQTSGACDLLVFALLPPCIQKLLV